MRLTYSAVYFVVDAADDDAPQQHAFAFHKCTHIVNSNRINISLKNSKF